MSQEYCILDLLNIKDKNIKLIDNFYKMEKLTTLIIKLSKQNYLMNHYIVLNAGVFLMKILHMKRMVLNHQIYSC